MRFKIERFGDETGILLPPEFLERHGISPGDWLDAVTEPGGALALSRLPRHPLTIERHSDSTSQIEDPAEPET